MVCIVVPVLDTREVFVKGRLESMERSGPPPRLFGLVGWILVALVFVGVTFYGLSVYLDWIVFQSMYASKAGLDWFAINFYHNNTFIVAGVLALLFINPIPRRSHLFEGLSAVGRSLRACQRGTGSGLPRAWQGCVVVLAGNQGGYRLRGNRVGERYTGPWQSDDGDYDAAKRDG